MAELNAWPFGYRIQFVRANLSEAARDWFLYRKFDNWESFVKQFRSTFVRRMIVSDCWDALKSRRQGKDEPVMKYFQEKVRLCRELSLHFSETRDYVLRGLNRWELVQYALRRDHRDEDELLHDLLDWTRMYTVRGEHEKSTKPLKFTRKDFNQRTTKFEPRSTGDTMTAVAAAVDTESRPSNVLNCWRCRKEGHISRDCPVQRSTLKCFNCRGEGHFSRQCPERRTTNLVASRSDLGAHPYDKCGEIMV